MPENRRDSVLVVDDVAANIKILRAILESEFELHAATSGSAALEIVRTTAVSLVLLDIIMPEMDGYEVCQKLKADPKTRDIPVIFLSALDGVQSEAKGLQMGAVDFISKPFDASVVRVRIRNHLELKHHRERLEEAVRQRTAQLEAANVAAEKARREAEAARKEAETARDAAQAGDRAKTEFLMIIGHELRTPLNNILGFVPFLADASLEQEQREENVAIISDAGYALLTVINSILELVQLESGKVVAARDPFLLTELVTKMMQELAPEARDRDLQLTHHIDPDIPELLIGDGKRLRQILNNLLNNALKFTTVGGISLTAVRESTTTEEQTLRFSIKDSGIGIAPEHQERIFQHFTQLEDPHIREHDGIGLGLTICKRFVPLLKGRIWVESTLGEGSVFHFTARFGVIREMEPIPTSLDSP